MYFTEELVYKSYIPDELKKGMLFINKLYPGTDKEQVEIFALSYIPKDIDAFYTEYGYPIEFFIIEEGNINSQEIIILATHDQIGWWDDGEDSDELFDITLKQLNNIFNYYGGFVDIYMDGISGQPKLIENKVILSYVPEVDEDEDYDEREEYFEDDEDENEYYEDDEDDAQEKEEEEEED